MCSLVSRCAIWTIGFRLPRNVYSAKCIRFSFEKNGECYLAAFRRVTFATSRSAPIHIWGWVAWHFEEGLRRTCRKSSPMQLLSTLSSYFPYPTWLWPSKKRFQFLAVRFSIDNRYRRSLLIKELPRFPSFFSHGSFLRWCKFPMASKHWKDLKALPSSSATNVSASFQE